MAERAQVSSVEAIADFRSRLIVFMGKARSGIEEASEEIRRTRAWLENEQRPHWEIELRRRRKELDEAGQVLFSAKLSATGAQSSAQALVVERAKQSVRDAEEKRAQINKWIREFETRAEPLGREIDQLLNFVGNDLGKAAAYLGSVLGILDAYASVGGENRVSEAAPASVDAKDSKAAVGPDGNASAKDTDNPLEDKAE